MSDSAPKQTLTGAALIAAIKRAGTRFVVELRVQPGDRYPEDFARLYAVESRERFRRALARA